MNHMPTVTRARSMGGEQLREGFGILARVGIFLAGNAAFVAVSLFVASAAGV